MTCYEYCGKYFKCCAFASSIHHYAPFRLWSHSVHTNVGSDNEVTTFALSCLRVAGGSWWGIEQYAELGEPSSPHLRIELLSVLVQSHR